MAIIHVSDMVEVAEYLPYLHLDDVFVTGILGRTIGVNHVLWLNYRHVSFEVTNLLNILYDKQL